jgi:histone H3/H4
MSLNNNNMETESGSDTETSSIVDASIGGPETAAAARRPRRRRTTKLERRISRLQTSGKPMVPKKSFSGLLTRTLREVQPPSGGYRLAKTARNMLQIDTEYYMSMLFAKALAIAKLRGGVTVSSADLRVAKAVESPSFAPEGI